MIDNKEITEKLNAIEKATPREDSCKTTYQICFGRGEC